MWITTITRFLPSFSIRTAPRCFATAASINLEYGAYAPGAPDVFIDDAQFKNLWLKPERSYIVAKQSVVPQLESLVGAADLNLVAASGGKVVLTNHPISYFSGGTPKDGRSVLEYLLTSSIGKRG